MLRAAAIAAAVTAAMGLAACAAAIPGEGGPWGRFLGTPTLTLVDAPPYDTYRLENDLGYDAPDGVRWTARAGLLTDGASIPQVFWAAVGGPLTGAYVPAAVVHDEYVGSKERPPAETHRAFYTGMRAKGVPEAQAKLMYWAVLVFAEDWTVGAARAAAAPQVDLADEAQAAFALSKFVAVARTLETSGGRILDVLPSGNVSGDLASLEANARFVRGAIAATGGAALRRGAPPDLGLGAAWEGVGPDGIEPWPGGVLPRYADLPRLSEAPGAQAFVLDDPAAAAARQAAARPPP